MVLQKSKLTALLASILVALCLVACSSGNGGGNSSSETEAEDVTQIQASTYKADGGDWALMTASYNDFASAGLELGDSCNIEFENGYKLEDVPFYTGEYVLDGNPVIVAKDGMTDVIIKNKNSDFWTPAGLFDGAKVTVTLNTKARFKDTQDLYPQIVVPQSSDESAQASQANAQEETDDTETDEQRASESEDPKLSSAGGPSDE